MKNMKLNILIIFLLYLAVGTGKPYLSVKNHKIYDQNGGERIFHGVNVVEKNPPYYDREFTEQ